MKRIIAGALAVVLIGLGIWWGMRVYQLNQKYPKDVIHQIKAGDSAMLAEDISMTITGCQWISFEEAGGQYVENELTEDGYYYVVEILLVNTGTEEANADLTQVNLETEGYLNGISLDVFLSMNDEPTLHPVLQPGESRSVLLTYTLYPIQWKAEDWAKLKGREFLLSLYDYPDKWCWDIQENK